MVRGDLARRARRIVYVSSSGVTDGADRRTDPINRLHADMEQLIARSGAPWTALRADTLAPNTLGWTGQLRAGGVVRGPAVAPTAVVHEGDVAAVAVHALTDERYAGVRLVLTGPQPLSRAEQVRTIGEAVGRPARFGPVPVEAARRQLLADGRPSARS